MLWRQCGFLLEHLSRTSFPSRAHRWSMHLLFELCTVVSVHTVSQGTVNMGFL